MILIIIAILLHYTYNHHKVDAVAIVMTSMAGIVELILEIVGLVIYFLMRG